MNLADAQKEMRQRLYATKNIRNGYSRKVNRNKLALGDHMSLCGIKYVKEYRFDEVRRWRFDYAMPEKKIAIEVDGGQWMVRSGHGFGAGFARDREKDREAQLQGWKVFRFTTGEVDSGVALQFIEKVVRA